MFVFEEKALTHPSRDHSWSSVSDGHHHPPGADLSRWQSPEGGDSAPVELTSDGVARPLALRPHETRASFVGRARGPEG